MVFFWRSSKTVDWDSMSIRVTTTLMMVIIEKKYCFYGCRVTLRKKSDFSKSFIISTTLTLNMLDVFFLQARSRFLVFLTFRANSIHAWIQKFLSEGVQFDVFFLVVVDEGRKNPDTTIRGPSSARQRNTI